MPSLAESAHVRGVPEEEVHLFPETVDGHGELEAPGTQLDAFDLH